jgi:murein DD-endopeptidase MepM/ murein hydrolase activator NlpD
MLTAKDLGEYFKLQLPIKDGDFWDGRPREYSNLKQWKLHFTQRFGMNLCDYGQFGLRGHNGIDIGGLSGTPIVAPCRLWIAYTKDDDQGYGRMVRGETDSIKINGDYYKLELTFGHFSKVTSKVYHWVEQGAELGLMGTSGFSTGNHLHFGVRVLAKINETTWQVMNYDNGFKGSIDPEPFMPHIIWDLTELLRPEPPKETEKETNIKDMLQKFKRDKTTGALYFVKPIDNVLYKQKFDDVLAPLVGALGDEFGIESWNTDKIANIKDHQFFGKA